VKLSVMSAARGGEDVVRLADAVVERLGDSEEPSTRLTLALALVQKFLALGMLGRPSESSAAAEAAHEYPEEALQVLDGQISSIDHDTDRSSGANFATRQLLRASILISLDRDEEGVIDWSAVERLRTTTPAVHRLQRAAFNREEAGG
jgi:hypothetical protein